MAGIIAPRFLDAAKALLAAYGVGGATIMRTCAALLRGPAIAAAIAVAGCAEYEAHRQQEQIGQAQAQAANDDAQCRSYGVEPGSQMYVQCRMNLDNQRAQLRNAVAAQIVGGMIAPPH
jgi:hypothetical protein